MKDVGLHTWRQGCFSFLFPFDMAQQCVLSLIALFLHYFAFSCGFVWLLQINLMNGLIVLYSLLF